MKHSYYGRIDEEDCVIKPGRNLLEEIVDTGVRRREIMIKESTEKSIDVLYKKICKELILIRSRVTNLESIVKKINK